MANKESTVSVRLTRPVKLGKQIHKSGMLDVDSHTADAWLAVGACVQIDGAAQQNSTQPKKSGDQGLNPAPASADKTAGAAAQDSTAGTGSQTAEKPDDAKKTPAAGTGVKANVSVGKKAAVKKSARKR